MNCIFLCDESGVMAEPWAEAGFDCLCIDTAHELRNDRTRGRTTFRHADVRHLTPSDLPQPVAFMAAFPPCTHLAGSGARARKRKGLGKLIDALETVHACERLCEWMGCPYLLENPAGWLSSWWAKPCYTFNPCDFGGYLDPPGDAYTKRTCLWTGGGFVMPEHRAVEPVEGSKMHGLTPGPDRARLRSQTPAGFAQAVFEANSRLEAAA